VYKKTGRHKRQADIRDRCTKRQADTKDRRTKRQADTKDRQIQNTGRYKRQADTKDRQIQNTGRHKESLVLKANETLRQQVLHSYHISPGIS
jgi:hypothetical protein